MIATLWNAVVFMVFAFGFGAACAPGRVTDVVLRLTSGVAMAFGVAFAIGFAGFVMGASNTQAALAVASAATAVMVARRRTMFALLSAPDARRMLAVWLLFAGWSLGLLALVRTYSGGGWAADWMEHWQRTVFFVERQPMDTRFGVIYPLTARPPLVNLVVALLLAGSRATFANYQLFLTLCASLVALPCAVLARRWGKRVNSGTWVVLLLMLNPLVAQNLTFSWTKLPTAFFVLTSVCLALEGLRSGTPFAVRATGSVCLGLGVLAHYSSAPWAIASAVGYVAAQRGAWTSRRFWSETAMLAAVFAVLVGIWVSWAVGQFGWRHTFESNTTAQHWKQQTRVERVTTPLLNVVDTLVPFPLRTAPEDGLIEQASRLGRVRDVAFSVYQLNLPLAIGTAGLWVFALTLLRRRPGAPSAEGSGERERRFLLTALPVALLLGIAVHTPRDEWGLTHICLQPLVLMGLAAMAATLPALPAPARRIWAALATVDFALGVAVHFGLESWALARFVAPDGNPATFLSQLSRAAVTNANDKCAFRLAFFADEVHAPVTAVVLGLALCFAGVILRLRTTPPSRL